MSVPTTVDELIRLYEHKGEERYGEDVSQLEHALQCAALAREGGASDALVCAALLHDVGHLVVERDGTSTIRLDTDDDHHEAVGARVLATIFGADVAAPVALHVRAKRWRCAVDPDYLGVLSDASRKTLRAQGGPLDRAACDAFESHPASAQAVALRSWDDAAKDPSRALGEIRDYEPLLRSLAARRA